MANVLKLYLETLPEPLLTHRLYDSVLAAATIRDEDDAEVEDLHRREPSDALLSLPRRSSRAVVALRTLLERLDAASRRTLRVTLAFASRVALADAATATERRLGRRFVGDSDGSTRRRSESAEATRALAAALRAALLRPPRGWTESAEDIVAATRAVELLILRRDDVVPEKTSREDASEKTFANANANDAERRGARRAAHGVTAGACVVGHAARVLSDKNAASTETDVGGEGRAKDFDEIASTKSPTRTSRTRDEDGKENRAEADAERSPRSSSPRSSSPFAERAPPTRSSRRACAEEPTRDPSRDPSRESEEYVDESAKARADESATESWISACAGSLFAGDDVITGEMDRACGSNLDALYVIPVHELSGPALAAEKHAIKRRLRSFDNGVEAYSGRKATKEDKRHLRPLYLRLAHVKRRMHALETSGAGMGARIANAGGGERR